MICQLTVASKSWQWYWTPGKVLLSRITAASAWFHLSLPQSSIVALTIFLVVTLGSVVGASLPLIFKRLGMDPALMSNPLIAALSDAVGVVIYYSVAILIIERLAQH